jgi:hypothetical protein
MFRIAAVALPALSLAACWTPIYNESLSASAALSQKLGGIASWSGEIGPIGWNSGTPSAAYEFLPGRFSALDCGLLVQRQTGNISVSYFGQADAGGYPVVGGSLGGSQGFAAGTVVVSAAVSADYAARLLLLGLNGDSSSKDLDLQLYYRDPADPSCSLAGGPLGVSPSGLSTASYLVAAGSVLDPNGSADDIELLYWDPAGSFRRYGVSYDALASTSTDGPYPVAGTGLDVNIGSRFFRLQNDFYLCAYSGPQGRETCYRWPDSGAGAGATLAAAPSVLASIKAPIVGILSQQALVLAQDDLFLYAFDKTGNQVFKLAAGNLRFEQEFGVNGQICALFTQVIATQSNNQGSIAAKTWAVKSALVRSLGD